MPRSSGETAWVRRHLLSNRVWRLADARGQILGRLAAQIARVLQGKHKPTYLDNVFSGDPVVVVNASEFALTGRKMQNKRIISHTGRPGGLKRRSVAAVLARRPSRPLYLAVKRMLPPNKLRRERLEHLHIYPGPEHPHATHKPALLPPSHIGADVGSGRPPPLHDMETWWLDQACEAPDEIIAPIVARTRAALAPRLSRGLADLLLPDKEESPANADALRDYARAAEAEKAASTSYPVVVPA